VTTIDFPQDTRAHVGGTLAFGPDGMLYISVGDSAGLTARSIQAQDLSTPVGALLRITPDGDVPSDNPFVSLPGGDPRVYAYGLRNPFDFTFDIETGALWANDVGAANADEFDHISSGGNYGWPIVAGWAHEQPFELPTAVFEQPTTPTGIVLYRGAMFPEWAGDLLACSFNSGLLHHVEAGDLTLEGPAPVSRIAGTEGCVTDISVAADGSLYLLDFFGGRVLRLAR
jgi:glucose/arabinose dehydrogenase